MAYIEFKNIDKFYGDNHVLKGINLEIKVISLYCWEAVRMWKEYPSALPGRAGADFRRTDPAGWGRYHKQGS